MLQAADLVRQFCGGGAQMGGDGGEAIDVVPRGGVFRHEGDEIVRGFPERALRLFHAVLRVGKVGERRAGRVLRLLGERRHLGDLGAGGGEKPCHILQGGQA